MRNPARKVICINCNKEIKRPHRGSKYCNNKCQHRFQQKIVNKEIEKGNVEGLCDGAIKRYLIEKHGNKCLNSNCGWDWNKPCGVELEHIDGNSSNQKLINVTLLCPNCHSLTPTYKAKNKGNGREYRRKKHSIARIAQ